MSKPTRFPYLLVLLVMAAGVHTAQADSAVVPPCAVWQGCGQWDNTVLGGFNLYNNIWGSGAGSQCIWACSGTNWGIWADHPATGGVKSYANVAKPNQNHRISTMPTVTSSFSVSVPSSGAYTTTYDIWSGGQTEIMIWMNKQGDHGPWAHAWDAQGNPIPIVSNVSVGGHTWNVYNNGASGGLKVWSMIRTSNTSSATVDIRACLQYLRTLPQFPLGDVVIDNYQFGFEISQSPGGSNFTCSSYSLNIGSGGGTPTSMSVAIVNTTTVSAGGGKKRGQSAVTIRDNLGNPVSGATVTGNFTGTFNESGKTATTNSSGVATLQTIATASGKPSVTFCVTNVTKSGLTYNSAGNTVTCDSN
jgi:hypothetical protein